MTFCHPSEREEAEKNIANSLSYNFISFYIKYKIKTFHLNTHKNAFNLSTIFFPLELCLFLHTKLT